MSGDDRTVSDLEDSQRQRVRDWDNMVEEWSNLDGNGPDRLEDIWSSVQEVVESLIEAAVEASSPSQVRLSPSPLVIIGSCL